MSTTEATGARLVLTIAGVPYLVRPVPPGEMPPEAVRSFKLTRRDAKVGRISHLIIEAIDGRACSCPDWGIRRRRFNESCKHLQAAEAVGLF